MYEFENLEKFNIKIVYKNLCMVYYIYFSNFYMMNKKRQENFQRLQILFTGKPKFYSYFKNLAELGHYPMIMTENFEIKNQSSENSIISFLKHIFDRISNSVHPVQKKSKSIQNYWQKLYSNPDLQKPSDTQSLATTHFQLNKISENHQITILLIGESGSGKTSMIKSLIYILEGVSPYDSPSKLDIFRPETHKYEDISLIIYAYNHLKTNTKITFVELPGIESKMDRILEGKMVKHSVEMTKKICPKLDFVIVTQRGDQYSMNCYLSKVLTDLIESYTDEKAFKILLTLTFYADSLVFELKSLKVKIDGHIKINNCVEVQKNREKGMERWKKCAKKLGTIIEKLELGS